MSGSGILRLPAAALMLIAALSGCTSGSPDASPEPSESTASPAPSPSPSRTPSPDAEPRTEPIAIPSCEEALPLARLQEMYGDPRIEAIPDVAALREYTLQHEFGPVAADALLSAEQSAHCVWGYPDSDFVIQVYAATLTTEARSTLVAALDDSDFERSDEGETIIFGHYTEKGVAPVQKTYFFRGDLWVAEMSSGSTSAVGREFLDRITD